jgi:putative acetyltransferase
VVARSDVRLQEITYFVRNVIAVVPCGLLLWSADHARAQADLAGIRQFWSIADFQRRMMDVVVRVERPADVAAIRQINELAFAQTLEADLVDQLRESCSDSVSLIAENAGVVVGHILFTPAVIEAEARFVPGMALAPMAVHPDWQRHGIGSRLVERGVLHLRERRCPFIVVVGHPDYYPRFGFERAYLHRIACQWEGVPDEAFMILILEPQVMVGVSGIARYRKEFDAAV